MTDEQPARTTSSLLLIVVIVPALLFAPLIASLLENTFLGSDHIYDLFDAIGLADPLEVIYSPLVDLFD